MGPSGPKVAEPLHIVQDSSQSKPVSRLEATILHRFILWSKRGQSRMVWVVNSPWCISDRKRNPAGLSETPTSRSMSLTFCVDHSEPPKSQEILLAFWTTGCSSYNRLQHVPALTSVRGWHPPSDSDEDPEEVRSLGVVMEQPVICSLRVDGDLWILCQQWIWKGFCSRLTDMSSAPAWERTYAGTTETRARWGWKVLGLSLSDLGGVPFFFTLTFFDKSVRIHQMNPCRNVACLNVLKPQKDGKDTSLQATRPGPQ